MEGWVGFFWCLVQAQDLSRCGGVGDAMRFRMSGWFVIGVGVATPGFPQSERYRGRVSLFLRHRWRGYLLLCAVVTRSLFLFS